MNQQNRNATDVRSVGGDKATRELPALLDVQAVATLLNCSARHVYRLANMGRMPQPVKLGALVRWSRAAIESWIHDGCPNCRKAVRFDPWDFEAEAAWQTGRFSGQADNAWMATVVAGYTFKDLFARLRLSVGYDYASGDDLAPLIITLARLISFFLLGMHTLATLIW